MIRFEKNPAVTAAWARMSALFADEAGQDLVEYALAAVLVGLAAVAAMKTLGSAVAKVFTTLGTTITTNT